MDPEVEKTGYDAMTSKLGLAPIDSLGLAEMYLNHGLDVVLIDYVAVQDNGLDISAVIACEVLDADCGEGDDVGEAPIIMRTHSNTQGDFDVSQYKLDLIEEAIQNYDCRYQGMIDEHQDVGLILLYPDNLNSVLDKCDGIPSEERIWTIDELRSKIIEVGKIVEDVEYSDDFEPEDDWDNEDPDVVKDVRHYVSDNDYKGDDTKTSILYGLGVCVVLILIAKMFGLGKTSYSSVPQNETKKQPKHELV
jgi:hypothetical protein